MVQRRKLIEVALPLEVISQASQAEKNRKVGKPQNLHHWWSRKPVTAARAFLLGQLLDDPSSNPDAFPTLEDQARERARLHRLIARSVEWDTMSRPALLDEIAAELGSQGLGEPPVIHDPFLGGGSLLLEAQRMGLDGIGSDLNPVAVLLSRALLEIPPKFAGQRPVSPAVAESQIRTWHQAQGLAADVEDYGEWMRKQAEARLGAHYPKTEAAVDTGRRELPVLAWVWARTVTCPNPACRIEMPLVAKWSLAKKAGKQARVVPEVVPDPSAPAGRRVRYVIGKGASSDADGTRNGTVNSKGAVCVACNASVGFAYIREEGRGGRIGAQLIAIVGEGSRRRVYLPPTEDHIRAAQVTRPIDGPDGEIPYNPRNFNTPIYGMDRWSTLFTDRQLLALTTFSDLVSEVRQEVLRDARAAGLEASGRLSDGGLGAEAYADAVAVYLALAVSRLADWSNSVSSWESTGEVSQHLFTGQKIGMAWDYSEANVLGDGNSGSFKACVKAIAAPLAQRGAGRAIRVELADARKIPYRGVVVNTDPPYYDNIAYGDLADFYYVWQRRSLSDVYPDLYATMSVPKADEIIAHQYRAGGVEAADVLFETSFRDVFEGLHKVQSDEYPVVVYYASRQSERLRRGEISTSWSAVLEGLIGSGWQITATWPVRSENVSRAVAQGANVMASSIVMALRARPTDAGTIDRRGFMAALDEELTRALRDLEHGVGPLDLQQAALGPGMAVFSRFAAIIEDDGSRMSVRSALARITETLDHVLNEQEGDFDATTRFALAWYRQHGYGVGKFGVADDVARSRNTTVDLVERTGILTSRAGNVQLIRPSDLSNDYNVIADAAISGWEVLQHLIRVLEVDGIAPAGDFLMEALRRTDQSIDPNLLLELGHLLFRIAEGNGWTSDALAFNNLVTSWPDIVDVARGVGVARPPVTAQSAFDFDEDE